MKGGTLREGWYALKHTGSVGEGTISRKDSIRGRAGVKGVQNASSVISGSGLALLNTVVPAEDKSPSHVRLPSSL